MCRSISTRWSCTDIFFPVSKMFTRQIGKNQFFFFNIIRLNFFKLYNRVNSDPSLGFSEHYVLRIIIIVLFHPLRNTCNTKLHVSTGFRYDATKAVGTSWFGGGSSRSRPESAVSGARYFRRATSRHRRDVLSAPVFKARGIGKPSDIGIFLCQGDACPRSGADRFSGRK